MCNGPNTCSRIQNFIFILLAEGRTQDFGRKSVGVQQPLPDWKGMGWDVVVGGSGGVEVLYQI